MRWWMTVVKFRKLSRLNRDIFAAVAAGFVGAGLMLAYYAGAIDNFAVASSSRTKSQERVEIEPFRDRDCTDFADQQEAQEFYEAEGPGDPHNLDADRDGIACNWNAR